MTFRSTLEPGLIAAVCLAAASADAAIYYVAPNGSDGNPGTIGSPFATMQKGHDVASEGDTVYIRGGTYKGRSERLTKSGKSASQRICFWAYSGEKPYYDCSSGGWGISVTGSWLPDASTGERRAPWRPRRTV